MVKEIQIAVDNFKSKNGGRIVFTTKEIIVAIWEKLDGMDGKMNKYYTKTERKLAYHSAGMKLMYVLTAGIIIKLMVFNN